MKAPLPSNQMTIALAKEVLETNGLRFVRSEVKRWRYDWTTTYKQGDSGVAKERLYYFDSPEGERVFNTRCLKGYALSLCFLRKTA